MFWGVVLKSNFYVGRCVGVAGVLEDHFYIHSFRSHFGSLAVGGSIAARSLCWGRGPCLGPEMGRNSPKKAKAKQPKKQVRAAKVVEPADTPPPGLTLVEQEHWRLAHQTTKRKHGRPSKMTEAEILKRVKGSQRDTYKKFLSYDEMHKIKVNGLTLTDRLVQDHTAVANGQAEISFGKNYTDERVAEYSRQKLAELPSALEPHDENAAIDPTLYYHLEQATLRAPLRGGLTAFLASGYAPKCQEEIVAVLRLALRQKSWLGGDSLKLLETISWWQHSQDLVSKFPAEIKAWYPTLDGTMAQVLSNFLNDGWSPADFLRTYTPLCALYISVPLIEELLLVEDSWDNHHEKLEDVCRWELGRKLFGFASDSLVNHKIKVAIQSALDETLDVNGVSTTSRSLYRMAVEEKLDWLDASWRDFPRMTALEYLNESWQHEVSSLKAEIDAREYLYILNWAHGLVYEEQQTLVLPHLFREWDLAEDPSQSGWPEVDFDVSVIQNLVDVREKMNTMLDAESQTDGSKVLEWFKAKKATLLPQDPCIDVMESWFRYMHSECAEKRVKAFVDSELPSSHAVKELRDVYAAFETEKGKLYVTFMREELRSPLESVMSWITDLMVPKPPDFRGVKEDKYLQACRLKLANFLTTPKAEALSSEDVSLLTGELAAVKMYRDCADISADGERSFDKSVLRKLSAFQWLLSPSQATTLDKWVQELYVSAGSSSGKGKGKVKSSPAEKRLASDDKKAKGSGKQGGSVVSSLFKKSRTDLGSVQS